MKINLNLVGVGLNELRIIEQKSTKNNKNIKSDKKSGGISRLRED